MELADQKCIPCKGDVPRLAGAELRQMAARLPGWKVVDEHHIERLFQFPDFVSALDFVRRVGAIAEEQGHHPDIHLTWGGFGGADLKLAGITGGANQPQDHAVLFGSAGIYDLKFTVQSGTGTIYVHAFPGGTDICCESNTRVLAVNK